MSAVGLRGQEGMVVGGVAPVGMWHPHAAVQVTPEKTGMWGRSEDLQKCLWEERRMLRVANMGLRRQTCRVWGGETMWTNSQIQLLALSARLTLCLLFGWPQDPLQFLFVFYAVTILPWFCFTGKPKACLLRLIETLHGNAACPPPSGSVC